MDEWHNSLESQSLRNSFITFSRLIHVNCFVSHLFLNFFRSQHDVLLFKHASLCQSGSISVISWFNRSGSNQVWVWNLTQLSKIMWLITVLSLFNRRGQFIFHIGPDNFGQLFSLNKWNHHLKTAFCIYCMYIYIYIKELNNYTIKQEYAVVCSHNNTDICWR